MEENRRLREVLRCIADLPMDRCSTENDYRLSAAKAIALGALSQQAEPTDTAPHPEQSGLVDMVRLALHNGQLVPDPEMDGSTEVFGIKIDDMEALEAALSAQRGEA